MGDKAGKGNNCDSCAEKHCSEVVANRAILRATRLDIVVVSPLFSQLLPDHASALKPVPLSLLVNDLVLLDTEAHHRSHQFSDTYELAAFRTSDSQEFYAYASKGLWCVWIGISVDGKMEYSVEKQLCTIPQLFKLFNDFVGLLPIGYYASSNAVDFNRLKGLYSGGGGDISQQSFLNLGYEVTFRLFGPYGAIQTPDVCQPTIHKFLSKAGSASVDIPGTLHLKNSRKVFDDVVMLHNIWISLKQVFEKYELEDGDYQENEDDYWTEEDDTLFE